MPFVKVATLADLPPGSVMQFEAGDETIALCNVDGQIHALEGICPHAGGPLGQGALHGATLVCPWHGWEYDCLTGRNTMDESIRLAKFPVRVENGEILVDLSPHA